MAPQTIILRFRDTTPGIDTIVEHRALLAQHGSVGWGWWKKTFEDGRQDELAEFLKKAGETEVVVIDRSTERAFRCRCTGFSRPKDAEPGLVPEYYRRHLAMTEGVFNFTAIDDIVFDPALGDRMGDSTFMWSGAQPDAVAVHVAAPSMARGRSCVLHLSDLHFGTDYAYLLRGEKPRIGDPRRTLTDCVTADLDRLGLRGDIAAMIVTGDFMTHGDFTEQVRAGAIAELDALRAELGLERDQLIAVPGNHDVVRYPEGAEIDIRELAVENQARYDHETGFRLFVEELCDRNWKSSLNYVRRISLDKADLDICVLNSCTIAATNWTEYGYVGKSGIDTIEELGEQPVDRPTFRFLALHHHLLPVADVEALNRKGVSLALDASDILFAGQKAGAQIALHGHQHMPKVSLYQALGLNGQGTAAPIYVVANGSAGAKNARLPAGQNNTYALFRLDSDGVELWIRELRLNAQAGLEAFHGTLPAPPLQM